MGPSLKDRFGRHLNYLRVALTDRCNMRCVYCMPEQGVAFQKTLAMLAKDEILRVLRVAVNLGVRKVRFTGGEPLLRPDFASILEGVRRMPDLQGVYLTTNGLLLSKRLPELKALGLSGVNVSLDSLDEATFQRMTRRRGLNQVLSGIRDAVHVGIPSVKVNVVLVRGVNDGEISKFVRLARGLPITVRFIELMPFDAEQIFASGSAFSASSVLRTLKGLGLNPLPQAGSSMEGWVVEAGAGSVAVLPSFSRTQCGTCNRLRLTADGQLRTCLYSDREHDLRRLLREGADDSHIAALFRQAVREKAQDGFHAQGARGAPRRSSMTQIGG